MVFAVVGSPDSKPEVGGEKELDLTGEAIDVRTCSWHSEASGDNPVVITLVHASSEVKK